MDRAGMYLAPLLNLPPRGAYSDAKQVVQQLNLLNARGANMVTYGMYGWMDVCIRGCPSYSAGQEQVDICLLSQEVQFNTYHS